MRWVADGFSLPADLTPNPPFFAQVEDVRQVPASRHVAPAVEFDLVDLKASRSERSQTQVADELERDGHVGVGLVVLDIAESQSPEGIARFSETGGTAVVELDFKGFDKVSGKEDAGVEADALDAKAGTQVNVDVFTQWIDVSLGGSALADIYHIAAVDDALQGALKCGSGNIAHIRRSDARRAALLADQLE